MPIYVPLIRFYSTLVPKEFLALYLYTSKFLTVPEKDFWAFRFSPLDDCFIPTFSLSFALLDLSQSVFHRDNGNLFQLH